MQIQFYLESSEENTERRLSLKIDKVQTTLDSIVGDLEKSREDRTIGAHQTRELRIQVDGHEKRINKLEQAN